jgi:hypothetical protein
LATNYAAHKERAAEHSRVQSLKGRDIGSIPKTTAKQKKRRKACRLNLRLFCETYFGAVFNLPWSADQLTVLTKIEESAIHGGQFALAMPRGSGKTSINACAAEWVLLYGHRSYVVLIGATEKHAEKMLDNIKTDFETNDLLYEDFPEVIYPIRRLERISLRANAQLCNGKPTAMTMTGKELVIANIPKSVSAGSRIEVTGITGSFRGMQAIRPSDGAKIRPDFVLIDDPQTDESAKSPKQCRDRLAVIMGAVLGLAGPKKKIAAVMSCTVIARDDLADLVLTRKLHPEWQGIRTKLLRSPPTNTKLWEQYAEIRAKSLMEERGIKDATAFYIANQAAMDEGAEVSWKERFNPDEASGIQYAMNLKLMDEISFAAEYQNEPLSLDIETPLILKPESIIAKTIGIKRGLVPFGCTRITAFIDVQQTVLYYAVVAWDQDFTGCVIDYGCYPEQAKSYFYLREVSPTYATLMPNASWEAQLYAALEKLSGRLLGKEWQFADSMGEAINDGLDGRGLRITRLTIDANWGQSTGIVKQFCRQSPFSALLMPSHGKGIGADRGAMNDWAKKAGTRQGWNWRVSIPPDRHLLYDTNSWKTFVAQRLLSNKGDKGNLSIYNASPTQHKMFAEHITAEYPIPMQAGGMGRIVNEWHVRPNRENHWLDCLVGCYIGASEQGVLFTGHEPSSGAASKARRKLDIKF